MLLILLTLTLLAQGHATRSGPVDFDSEVRPILSDSCFACHGPDAGSRAAGLRLDTREGALADLGGYAAIVPGDAEGSELWARVTSEFEFEVMPPPEAHRKPLGNREREVLRRWINEGANWSQHWAFVPPKKAALPEGAAHPIDALVERRLRAEGLELAPAASARTLARRLSIDLVGLPPEPGALEALGETLNAEAWRAYVDALLDSPHHGERMAMWWLDVARYADSDGFQQDEVRTNWPWRDWVVRAFNAGMPFDEFATLQLAGDLLPGATEEQILATCFQRNHMHNGEGGRDPEESRVDYVRDRTNTLGTVFLGLTLECAQCHDHKFDPVSQRDYYRLSAFFDSIDESGHAGGGAGPFQKLTAPAAQPHLERARRELADADERLAAVRLGHAGRFEAWLDAQTARVQEGYQAWTPLSPDGLWTAEGSQLVAQRDGHVLCASLGMDQEDYFLEVHGSPTHRVTGLRLEIPRVQGAPGAGFSFTDDGEFIMTGVKLRVRKRGATTLRDVELASVTANVEGKGSDAQNGPVSGLLGDDLRQGWTTAGKEVDATATAVLALRDPLRLALDESLVVEILHRSTVPKAHVRAIRISVADEPGQAVQRVGATPLEKLSSRVQSPLAEQALDGELREELFLQYLEDVPAWQTARRERDRYAAQLRDAETSARELAVTVLRERGEPRVTSVLLRGVWDKKGEPVTRGFPGEVFAGDTVPESPSRLDLARWVTSRQNPLTARVIVNQIWQQIFGRGLVSTPSDFGVQGARPRYPELLDWLAVDFMESGWNVRHLLRTIVTSRVYAQASEGSPDLMDRDPHGDLLARGPRYRLPSWMIRDAALAVSGLLVDDVGGPPMYPHQPPGVWEDVFNDG
ncbi:Planctomycete cytochrome C [Planctomycetes bacterium Poly30]|uniref:Planctomycete cytochrome C n=1 Tax=Saltatorellus ferox TaxID=2528018 RepID=A0A518EUR5_9BACT|nr:Planctomycete cytochrome C [Planctomycetes bacterium Poly30]